jgi:hypothetical protein
VKKIRFGRFGMAECPLRLTPRQKCRRDQLLRPNREILGLREFQQLCPLAAIPQKADPAGHRHRLRTDLPGQRHRLVRPLHPLEADGRIRQRIGLLQIVLALAQLEKSVRRLLKLARIEQLHRRRPIRKIVRKCRHDTESEKSGEQTFHKQLHDHNATACRQYKMRLPHYFAIIALSITHSSEL